MLDHCRLRHLVLPLACSLALACNADAPSETDDAADAADHDNSSESTNTGDGDDPPSCGDGVIEPAEDCDGPLTLACSDYDTMYLSGSVTCTDDCRYDTSACDVGPVDLELCSTPALAFNDSLAASDTIVVDVGGTVVDVDVVVLITHSYLEDVHTSLAHVDTGVKLFGNFCGFNEDVDATFDDDAQTPLTCTPPPLAPDPPAAILGTMQPEQPLAAFDGLPGAGEWTLDVSDDFAVNSGTLDSWCLRLTVE